MSAAAKPGLDVRPASRFPAAILIPGIAFSLGAAALAQCAVPVPASGSLCGIAGRMGPLTQLLVMNFGMVLAMLPGVGTIWDLAIDPAAKPTAILRLVVGYCIPWALAIVPLSLAVAMLAGQGGMDVPWWMFGPLALVSLAMHRLGTAKQPSHGICTASLRDGAWLGRNCLCANLIPAAAMAVFGMARLESVPLAAAMVAGQFASPKISTVLIPLSLIAAGLASLMNGSSS